MKYINKIFCDCIMIYHLKCFNEWSDDNSYKCSICKKTNYEDLLNYYYKLYEKVYNMYLNMKNNNCCCKINNI